MADKKKDGAIPGIGLDVGTMNLVSARRGPDGLTTRRMRNVFLDLPPNAKKMLKLSKISFVERDDDIFILGDAALETANIFGKEARRPLQDGLISPGEDAGLEVLALLVKNVLGEPVVPHEVCFLSVPSIPIDRPGRDVVYHRGILERIVEECGFDPNPRNEAMAIIFAECADTTFSGVGMSFGAGMVNVALAVNTIEGLSFSVARGGDYIDNGAATSLGSTCARMCAIKEAGINIHDPQDRSQEAISFYYKDLIQYAIDKVSERFTALGGKFQLTRPIPIVVSGGTSMAGGFLDLFKKVFEKKRKRFPFEISEIRHASEPLNAVAIGLHIQARQEYEDE